MLRGCQLINGTEFILDNTPRNRSFWDMFIELWTGRVDRVAYALFGAWLLGMTLNYLSGNPMTARTALLGLLGNVIVIAIALVAKSRRNR